VHDDGVDGVLDLVADAGGEATDSGHSAGELELGLDGFGGFEVVEGEKRAQSLSRFSVVDELEGEFDAAAGFSDDEFLRQGSGGCEGLAESSAEQSASVEDLVGVEAENGSLLAGEKAPGSLGNKNGAVVGGEQKDAVLEVAENLIEVFLEGGEDFFDVAHAPAKALDLSRDSDSHVALARAFFFVEEFAGGVEGIELPADELKGAQSEVGEQEGSDEGRSEHEAHEVACAVHVGQVLLFEESGADADIDRQEGLVVAFDGNADVEDGGRAKDLEHQLWGSGTQQVAVFAARGQRLVFVVGVGAEDGDGPAVGDVDIIDGVRVAVHRLDHILKGRIAADGLNSKSAELVRMVRVDGPVGEAGFERPAHGEDDLVGNHAVGKVGLMDR
jgi:hypothetical protein